MANDPYGNPLPGNYTKPDGAPQSFGDFAEWIKQMQQSGAFGADFQMWDPSGFNQQAGEAYAGTQDVTGMYMDMANGTDPIAQAQADQQRKMNAEYMGRSGVTGSAAMNQMNRTEADLMLQQEQTRRNALAGAMGGYGQGFGIAQGSAGVNQAGAGMNNQWMQQGVDNNFGMADMMSMFPAFDIAWQSTGDNSGGGMSPEQMYQMYQQWQQEQEQSGVGGNNNNQDR